MGSNWRGIGKVEVYGNQGRYLPPDEKFKLKVIRSFTMKTRKKGDAFIVDFEVLETSTKTVKKELVYNWYQSMQDEDIAFPAIKAFMIALLGVDMDDEAEMKTFEDNLEDLMDEAGSEEWSSAKADLEDHPLHGRTVAVSTSAKKTNQDKDFTVHDWEPWDEEEEEEEEDEDEDED